MNTDSNLRTVTKTISYRFFVMLSLALTGIIFAKSPEWIIKFIILSWTIGLVSFLVHEKIWGYSKLWLDGIRDMKRRSVAKTITWRLWSLFVVFMISKFILGGSSSEAASYTIVSNIFFVVVHYCHERAWNTVRWGKLGA
jgi:uncharacterized membrane protein